MEQIMPINDTNSPTASIDRHSHSTLLKDFMASENVKVLFEMLTIVSPTKMVPPSPCVIEPLIFKVLPVNIGVRGEKKSNNAKNNRNRIAQITVGFVTDTNHTSLFKQNGFLKTISQFIIIIG